jgi:DNA-binding NarL/FixJ family response regulator
MKPAATKPSNPVPRITVVLADDNALVRKGFRTIIDREADIEVVGEARDGRQAVALATRLRPDIVLMDVAMPLLNGLDALRQVLQARSASKVLMLSAHGDEAYVQAAMTAGARGYLLKQTAAGEVCRAIRQVQKGKFVFSPALTQ